MCFFAGNKYEWKCCFRLDLATSANCELCAKLILVSLINGVWFIAVLCLVLCWPCGWGIWEPKAKEELVLCSTVYALLLLYFLCKQLMASAAFWYFACVRHKIIGEFLKTKSNNSTTRDSGRRWCPIHCEYRGWRCILFQEMKESTTCNLFSEMILRGM